MRREFNASHTLVTSRVCLFRGVYLCNGVEFDVPPPQNGVNIVLSIAAFLPIAEVSAWLAQIRQVSGLHCMGVSGRQSVAGAAVLPTVAADAPGAVMGPGACALELWRRLSRRAIVAQPT